MTEVQHRIQRRLDTLVSEGGEAGLQVAVFEHGRLIVDAVAGVADSTTGRPLTSSTPIFSFSTAKNVSATLAHVLVGRGHLDYEGRVTDLWPEFGVNGKASATLRHVLTHTVGLPAMPRQITPSDLPDWSAVSGALASAEPLWAPGSAMGYHSYTFGYLVGEMARRATGRHVSELLRTLITEPLGIQGHLWFAAPDDARSGFAHLEQPVWPSASADAGHESILAPWESQPSAELGNRPEIVGAEIPSVGSATALGLATMYDALLRGELVAPSQLAHLSSLAFEGEDRVNGTPARLALGFPLGRIGAPPDERSVAFGWPGGGGSYAYADPATGVAFALTKTRLVPDLDTVLSVAAIVADHLGGTR